MTRLLTFTCSFVPIAFLVSSCGESGTSTGTDSSEAPAVEVTVATVESHPFADTTIAIGTLRSDESVELSANVTERVKSLHFEDGEEVSEGQLIAQLTNDEEAAIVAIADSELAEEEREVARLGSLAKKESVAEVTLDERRTRMAVAKARIEQMRATMEDRRIVAPFDGIVGLRRISPGALVEPGTVITTIDKIDPMKLDFQVPEVFLREVQPGTKLQADVTSMPDEPIEVEVTTVDSRVNPVTRSIAVRALIPNPDKKLLPGMLVQVRLQRNERNALAIPERAIIPVADNQSVYVVEESVVRLREVETGGRRPGIVEVISGLSEGDRIVTDGVLSLRDGAAIEIAGEYEGPSPGFDPTATGTP